MNLIGGDLGSEVEMYSMAHHSESTCFQLYIERGWFKREFSWACHWCWRSDFAMNKIKRWQISTSWFCNSLTFFSPKQLGGAYLTIDRNKEPDRQARDCHLGPAAIFITTSPLPSWKHPLPQPFHLCWRPWESPRTIILQPSFVFRFWGLKVRISNIGSAA